MNKYLIILSVPNLYYFNVHTIVSFSQIARTCYICIIVSNLSKLDGLLEWLYGKLIYSLPSAMGPNALLFSNIF